MGQQILRDFQVLEDIDRAVFMDGGRIVEVGPPEHIFEDHERTKRLLNQILH